MSTSPKPSPTQVAMSLPEILEAVGSFIHLSELGSCVLVNHLWNKVFTPWLWRTVDDNTLNWSSILMDASFSFDKVVEKDEKWLREVLKTHGKHIRYLKITWITLLLNAGAEGSTITRLRSLAAGSFAMGFRFEEETPLYNLPILAGMREHDRPTIEQQQAIIDSHIISPAFKDALEPVPRLMLFKFIRGVVASQRFWLLVLQNPNLEYLHLGRHLGLSGEAFKKDSIIKIMASLPKLTRLKNNIMRRPLQQILGALPWLQNYSCSADISDSALNGLELDQPFPRLRSLSIKGYGPLRTASLFNLLEFLPNLEQLTINMLQHGARSSSESQETNTDKQGSSADKQSNHLRGLHFTKYDQVATVAFDEAISGVVLPALPFLNEITLRVLMPATVAALVEHCLYLETVKVLSHNRSNKIEMTLPENMPLVLLHGCPTLKHLYTDLHSVDAHLLLAKPIVCRGLETFCCQVVGVDRLTAEEQALYDSWTTKSMQEENTTIATDGQVTATMGDEEKSQLEEVLEKHRRSQGLHRQIYNTLSELTQLRRLDFGYDRLAIFRHREPLEPLNEVPVPETIVVDGRIYHKEYPPAPNMLKLSLDSGLGQLRTLESLKEFGFRGVDHRVGTEELDWMVRAWPRLETVLGVEDYLHLKHFGLDCEKSRMLMEYAQTTLRIRYE